MIRIKTILSLLGIMVFLGCSQEELPEKEIQNETLKTGVFLVSPVEGLYYETATQSGYTNLHGEFNYLKGENITFYLGEIELGHSPAAPVITPISIAKTSKASIHTPEVKYIAALLQTLDLDGNAKNGIKLDPRVLEVLEIKYVKGRKNAMANIVEMVQKVKEKTGIQLNEIFPEEAASHLAETLGEDYTSYQNLLSVLKSWGFSAAAEASFEWKTEFNDDGSIRKFISMEKYPYRLSSEYEIIEYTPFGHPASYIYQSYILGKLNYTEKADILYDESQNIVGIKRYAETEVGYSHFLTEQFTSFDENGFVTGYELYNPGHEFQYSYIIERLDNGNKTLMTRYSSKDIQNETTLEFQSEFTYTPFDDLETMQQLFENGSKRNNIYTYRKDNTLEKLTRTRSDRNTIYEYFYDENENRTELHISEGVWRSEYVEFYPDGDPKLVYTYYEEWLQEIATFDEEGYGVLKLWHLDKSGSYQIDYRTPEHKLYKIDYFDDNGNYVKTEHYDENENLISTEYA